jgi:hypothetical protein
VKPTVQTANCPSTSVLGEKVTVLTDVALAMVAVPRSARATTMTLTANRFTRLMGLKRDGPPRSTTE